MAAANIIVLMVLGASSVAGVSCGYAASKKKSRTAETWAGVALIVAVIALVILLGDPVQ